MRKQIAEEEFDEFEEVAKNSLTSFIKDCYNAFNLICAATEENQCQMSEFARKVKEANMAISDLDFYNKYLLTKQCFTTYKVNGEVVITKIDPSKFRYDKTAMALHRKKFGW